MSKLTGSKSPHLEGLALKSREELTQYRNHRPR